jgi:NADP-reducing hydrogenase subunit HndD
METVKLTIDNKEIEVPKGTTIYKAAKQLGIEIPPFATSTLKILTSRTNREDAAFVLLKYRAGVIMRQHALPTVKTEWL